MSRILAYWYNLNKYMDRSWNKVRVLALTLFVVGLFLGNLPTEILTSAADWDTIARVMLVISTSLFYLMLLRFLEKSYVFGPKIVMLIEMVSTSNDLPKILLKNFK